MSAFWGGIIPSSMESTKSMWRFLKKYEANKRMYLKSPKTAHMGWNSIQAIAASYKTMATMKRLSTKLALSFHKQLTHRIEVLQEEKTWGCYCPHLLAFDLVWKVWKIMHKIKMLVGIFLNWYYLRKKNTYIAFPPPKILKHRKQTWE